MCLNLIDILYCWGLVMAHYTLYSCSFIICGTLRYIFVLSYYLYGTHDIYLCSVVIYIALLIQFCVIAIYSTLLYTISLLPYVLHVVWHALWGLHIYFSKYWMWICMFYCATCSFLRAVDKVLSITILLYLLGNMGFNCLC